MTKGPFVPSQFTATEWSTEQDKADFGNTLLHFIESGFKQTLFIKKLYNRLSQTFGHIAHHDQHGFWFEWFTAEDDHVRFLEHILHHPCFGDAKFTFSDVERAVIREVIMRDCMARYQALADAALRTREFATLKRLEAKYRVPEPAEATSASQLGPVASPSVSEKPLIQASLF